MPCLLPKSGWNEILRILDIQNFKLHPPCSENSHPKSYKFLALPQTLGGLNASVCMCAVSQGNGQDSSSGSSHSALRMTLDELRQVNRYAESTKSLSYLPQVSREKLIKTLENVNVHTLSVLYTSAITYYQLPLFCNYTLVLMHGSCFYITVAFYIVCTTNY